jgi:hypothetical protein
LLVVHDRDLVVTDVVTDIVLMFKASEVLLDNQGGRTVFQSEELLHDISALRRFYSLSGIDGASSDGLQIHRGGMFRVVLAVLQ